MKKLLLLSIIIAGVFLAHAASSQRAITVLRQKASSACGSTYVGPGDIQASGWVTYGSLVAFNCAAAAAHANAIILCTPSDAACETETYSTTGDVALGTIGATCNNTTVICTVKELFDGTGAGRHLIQTTISCRSTFQVAYLGSFPALASPSGNACNGYFVTIPDTPQGVTFWTVTETENFGFNSPMATTNLSMFWDGGGGLTVAAPYPGSQHNIGGVGGNTWYAIASVFNGSSSNTTINASASGSYSLTGSTTSGTTLACGNSPGAGTYNVGYLMTCGMLSVAVGTGTQASLISSARAHFGF